MRHSLLLGALLLTVPATVPAAAPADFAPDPLPPIELSAVVPAPPDQVWNAFTTTEGVKKWMVSQADLDTRNGGVWKTKYGKEGMLGDEGTIFNEVLAVDPGRMYVLRIQKPPKGFPFMNTYRDMWTVVYFDPAEGDKTRVRLRAHGFNGTEESKKLRAFFERGNQTTLDALVRYFEKQAARAAEPFEGFAREVLEDGTLLVRRKDGTSTRVRLWGVALPEDPARLRLARKRLEQLAVGQDVRIGPRSAEGEAVMAVVRCRVDAFLYEDVDAGDLSQIMVRDGMARRAAEDPHLERLEASARAAKRGIWGPAAS